MPKKNLTYAEALERLEDIVKSVEEGMMPVEDLSAKLQEAQSLLALCRTKLRKTEEDVNKLLDNDTTQ